MAKDSNGIGATLLLVVRVCFRFGSAHPFVLSTLIFLLVLYRFFPFLFALFVSSSPVLICTTVLLGFLLSYGEPNAPDIGEDKRAPETSTSSLIAGRTAEGVVSKKNDASERTVKAAAIARPLPMETGRTEEQKVESSIKNKAEGTGKTGGDDSTKRQNKSKGLKAEVDKLGSESRLDSSLGSPWQKVDNGDACSVSTAESSSPEASTTEVVLEELHPLLHANAPQPALKSADNSDASSGDDQESEDDEDDEDNAHDDEDNDDAQEEKDDGNEKVIGWTEDDQKNLMDLGSSEMERNQRLENLIAKRSMRKRTLPESVTNLIDLDSNDPATTAEDPSRFHVQIPPRQNPFDVPFDSMEALGMPPIPGSAPSILLPRRNPFDLPFDQVDQGGGLTAAGPSHPSQFVPIPQRDPFFRRHESFSLGATLPGDFKQDKRDSHFKPYFVPDKVEETGFPSLQIQLSDKSDSKLSSVAESDVSSSVADEEHHKELLEEGLHQESELLSHVGPDAEPVEQGSESSEEVDSVDTNDEQIDTNIGDVHGTGLNTSLVTGATHHANGAGIGSSIPDAAKLEVIEDKYNDSSSSSSSEMSEKISNVSIPEESVGLEPARGDSSKVSSDSLQLPSKAGDGVDDVQVAEPVYDSSPSAAEKSLDADLFHAGKNGLNSSSSMASDMQANTSEAGSPPRPLGKNSSSRGPPAGSSSEDLAFPSGGLWVASPSLSSVDEIESRSREISEIRERDVIQVELPGPREDFVRQIPLALPRTISGRIIKPSSLSSVETTDSSEDSS